MKRHAIKFILFLLLGAMLNVGMAWAHRALEFTNRTQDYGKLIEGEHWPWPAPAEWSSGPEMLYGVSRALCTNEIYGDAVGQMLVIKAGWPLRSLEAGAIQQGHWRYFYCLDSGGACPTMVLWPGFAINTIFYAAILWLLFAFPFTVRRWRRIKRGLCVRCGYAAGTSDVCSECGAAVHGAAAPCNPCEPP